jgi:hypothetical protein
VQPDNPSDANTPVILILDKIDGPVDLVLNRTLEASELAVGEDASDPIATELPIIAGADRAESAIAALLLDDASLANAGHRPHNLCICVPHAAASAAEEVEAGPIVCGARRLIHWRLRRQISGRGRAGHGCKSH